MKRLFLLFYIFVFSAILNSMAQVTFVAKAPRNVEAGEQFRLQYVLSGADGDDFSQPSFHEFDVLAGPSVSTYASTQIVNGHLSSSRSVTYTYILQANHEGTFTLPSASVKAGGKTYKTKSLPIRVAAGQGGGTSAGSGKNRVKSAEEDEDDGFGAHEPQQAGSSVNARDLYFSVTPSKRRVYEQEPVLLTYRFHSRVGVGLANIMLRQKPDLQGFWTQEIDLPRNMSPQTERHDGALYRVGTNLQYLVFPQQTGKLTVPGVTFDCDVVQRDRAIDPLDAFFNGGGNISVKVQRRVDDLALEVLPLPEPRPALFSGGVGSFNIRTQLLTPSPRTNDIATLRVIVSGVGNMKLIKAPAIVFPKDFDTYEVKQSDHTRVTADGISGEVHFDYTFVPRNVGQYDLPAADFSYFDTQRGTYVTLHTTAQHLDVAKGTRSKEDLEAELAMRASDIRDVHLGAANRINRSGFWPSSAWIGSWTYFLRILLYVVIGISALRWIRRRVKLAADVTGMRIRHAGRNANRHLRNVERMIATTEHQQFYAALAQALRGYLADKLARDAASLTTNEIVDALTARDIENETCQAVRTLLDDCDFARFAPAGTESTRQEDFNRASSLIAQLESKFK